MPQEAVSSAELPSTVHSLAVYGVIASPALAKCLSYCNHQKLWNIFSSSRSNACSNMGSVMPPVDYPPISHQLQQQFHSGGLRCLTMPSMSLAKRLLVQPEPHPLIAASIAMTFTPDMELGIGLVFGYNLVPNQHWRPETRAGGLGAVAALKMLSTHRKMYLKTIC